MAQMKAKIKSATPTSSVFQAIRKEVWLFFMAARNK
jgi:hypothetical protein